MIEGSMAAYFGCKASHRMVRRKGNEATSPKIRSEFVKRLFERLSWFKSADGRDSMADKNSGPHDIMVSVILSSLEFASEEGQSPLQVLESVLLRYEATNGGPDIDMARESIKRILDDIESGKVRLT